MPVAIGTVMRPCRTPLYFPALSDPADKDRAEKRWSGQRRVRRRPRACWYQNYRTIRSLSYSRSSPTRALRVRRAARHGSSGQAYYDGTGHPWEIVRDAAAKEGRLVPSCPRKKLHSERLLSRASPATCPDQCLASRPRGCCFSGLRGRRGHAGTPRASLPRPPLQDPTPSGVVSTRRDPPGVPYGLYHSLKLTQGHGHERRRRREPRRAAGNKRAGCRGRGASLDSADRPGHGDAEARQRRFG